MATNLRESVGAELGNDVATRVWPRLPMSGNEIAAVAAGEVPAVAPEPRALQH